jgi:hypothetical protein
VRDQCGPGRLSCVWAGTDYDVRVSNRRDDTAPYHSTRVHVGDWVIVEVGTSGRTFLYVFSDSTFQRMYGPRPSVDAYDGVSNDKKEIT